MTMILTVASLLGNVNDPSREEAPSRWGEGSVEPCLELVVLVIGEVHPDRDDQCDEEGKEAEGPAGLHLHRRRLVAFVSPERVAEQHSDRVDRETIRWNDVHAIGYFGNFRKADAEEDVNGKLMSHCDVESCDGR